MDNWNDANIGDTYADEGSTYEITNIANNQGQLIITAISLSE